MKRFLVIALMLTIAATVHAQASTDMRIYRCTDDAGKLTLRDTPCPKGQQQQVREMVRPKDAPQATRLSPPVAPMLPPAPTATPVVFLAPPRPLYECVTNEGKRYTSDNGDGNPRWVPLWTQGYSAAWPSNSLGNNIGGPPPRPDQPAPPPAGGVIWPVAIGGTWIRDDCTMLPPRETCARLRDRRDEIRRRFFNAMPSERDVLRVEERTINARIDNDCSSR